LLYEILPIYDNLKISIPHADTAGVKNGWVSGIEHVTKQFKNVLAGTGVEEIKTIGEKFDPYTMEAVGGTGEIVAKEAKPGYKLYGKVIIPARVILEENN